MIYLDASVVLSRIFVERRRPPPAFWEQSFVASRLLEYEVFNRVHAYRATTVNLDAVRDVLGRVEMVDLSPEALARALDPFPVQVRTLDSLHLATMVYLRSRAQSVALASYDKRFGDAAVALGFELAAAD